MKRIIGLILLLAMLLICLVGCGNESDYEELIVGKWYFLDSDGTYDKESYIIFHESGTVEQCYKGKSDRIMYAIWSIDGATLTLMDDDHEKYGSIKISVLTETKFIGIEYDEDGDREGTRELVRGY